MKTFALLLVLLALITPPAALARDKHSRKPAAKTIELLDAEEVTGKLPSADAGVTDMYVSHDYKSTHPKARPGTKILELEADLLNDFLKGKGHFEKYKDVANKNKSVVLRRYEEGDKDVTEELIALNKAGLKRVLVILDFNPAMDGKFKEGEKSNVDFDAATYKEVPMAESIKRLRGEGGFKLNNLDHGIVSQPLYTGEMTPIMHNKDLFFIVHNDDGSIKEITLYTGSNNMTNNPRYNRMLRIVDQQAAQHVLDNAMEMAEVFSKGGAIKDIKPAAPLNITYKDGSSMELAFTDGKYNPNDRIQATLEEAAKDPGKIKMKRATFSEFVFTDGDVMEGLRSAMNAHPEMTTYAVLDDKFIALSEYGKGGALAGFNTSPPFGKSTFGFASKLRSRITAFGYQKQAEGRVETDPDGPPIGREVWHDKTSVLEYTEGGVDWVEVYTGSFNLSTNGANAELQIKFRVPASSKFGQMVVESIVKVAEANPEYALPLEKAVFRNFLGRLLGHSIFEIPVERVERVMRDYKAGNYKEAAEDLRAIAKEPTTLSKKLSPSEVEGRITKLTKFLEWAQAHAGPGAPKGISPQRLTAGAFGISNPEASPGRMIQSMRSALWEPNIDKEALEQKAIEAMKELEQPLPTPREPKGEDGKNPDELIAREGAPVKRTPRPRRAATAAEKCEPPLKDPNFKPGKDD